MEEKEKNKTKKVEEKTMVGNKNVTLDNATSEQLKVAAFDIDQKIKGLQRQYQVIINKLQEKINEVKQNGNS